MAMRKQSLVLPGLVALFMVCSVFFVHSLLKRNGIRQKKRGLHEHFDDVVNKEYGKIEGQNEKHVHGKHKDCKFGFTFLKSSLKSMLKKKKLNEHGDIIQPARGGLRQGVYCLDSADGKNGSLIEVQECHGQGRNQEWKINTDNMIENVGQTSMCLTAQPKRKKKSLVLRHCNRSNGSQKWNFHARKGRFSPELHSDLCLQTALPYAIIKPCVDKGKKNQMFEFIMTEIINLEDTVNIL